MVQVNRSNKLVRVEVVEAEVDKLGMVQVNRYHREDLGVEEVVEVLDIPNNLR